MPSTEELLKNQIVEKKAKIAELTAELRLDEKALAVYRDDQPARKGKAKMRRTKYKSAKSPKVGLARKMEGALVALQTPLTSSEFRAAVNRAYPEKVVSESAWSPQLSTIYRDKAKPFQRVEFPDNPSEYRFFYGLKSWFNGEKLKPEYLEGLVKRIPQSGPKSLKLEFA